MIPAELAEQVRSEVKRLKQAQDDFLQTYRALCIYHGGEQWQKEPSEMIFHRAREAVVPIMEELGMDHNTVQALCSWAEQLLRSR